MGDDDEQVEIEDIPDWQESDEILSAAAMGGDSEEEEDNKNGPPRSSVRRATLVHVRGFDDSEDGESTMAPSTTTKRCPSKLLNTC